jgi:DNA-binding transcriptional ArsR family regulator
MEKSYLIRDLDQVRALADPLRVRIVEAMRKGPRTTKQVADAFGEKPTRLYHHVDALERAGILRLVGTRRNRGTLEKYYEPVARTFVIDRDLFAPEQGAAAQEAAGVVKEAVTDMLRETAEEIGSGIAEMRIPLQDRSRVEMARVVVRAAPERIEALMERVHALLDEAQEEGEGTGEAGGPMHDYRLVVAFYPVDRIE